MEGTIVNFRMGRHTKSENQMIIKVKSVKSRMQAEKLKNKNVVWKTSSNKKITGKILAPHGNTGALKVGFEKGMPGQAIGTKVEIE